jgi:hypothetical protein
MFGQCLAHAARSAVAESTTAAAAATTTTAATGTRTSHSALELRRAESPSLAKPKVDSDESGTVPGIPL